MKPKCRDDIMLCPKCHKPIAKSGYIANNPESKEKKNLFYCTICDTYYKENPPADPPRPDDKQKKLDIDVGTTDDGELTVDVAGGETGNIEGSNRDVDPESVTTATGYDESDAGQSSTPGFGTKVSEAWSKFGKTGPARAARKVAKKGTDVGGRMAKKAGEVAVPAARAGAASGVEQMGEGLAAQLRGDDIPAPSKKGGGGTSNAVTRGGRRYYKKEGTNIEFGSMWDSDAEEWIGPDEQGYVDPPRGLESLPVYSGKGKLISRAAKGFASGLAGAAQSVSPWAAGFEAAGRAATTEGGQELLAQVGTGVGRGSEATLRGVGGGVEETLGGVGGLVGERGVGRVFSGTGEGISESSQRLTEGTGAGIEKAAGSISEGAEETLRGVGKSMGAQGELAEGGSSFMKSIGKSFENLSQGLSQRVARGDDNQPQPRQIQQSQPRQPVRQRIPDQTGPYGRGLGPGQGRADGTGMRVQNPPSDFDTVGDWLEAMAKTDTSTEKDGRAMQTLLRKIGYPRAKVVVGMVYLNPPCRPTSIQSTAQTLLKEIEKQV